jgi:hypothetical protein
MSQWGATSLAAVGRVWAVVAALAAAIATLIVINYRRLPKLRETIDAGPTHLSCQPSASRVWLASAP